MTNTPGKRILTDWAMLIPVLLALVIFAIPRLPLPSFWDEAWSYLPAIFHMAQSGPSLLPDPQTTELFRGHPLFFYATASQWIRIAGTSFPAMRILPLLISLLLLCILFSFSKKYFGRETAILTVIFLLIQSVFLAQSTMLLPEMMLALLTLLTLNAFLSRKKAMFILWGTLLVLTKETGVVLILACMVFRLAEPWMNREIKPFKLHLAESWHLPVPLLALALFFVAQKLITGWFFFPEHLGFIDLSPASVVHRLGGYASYLFIGFGRNLLSIAAGAALVTMMVRKSGMEKEKRAVIFMMLIFITGYLLFLSLNFYSPRYLLSILPLFLLLCAYVISKAIAPFRIWLWIALLVIFSNNLWFTWDKRTDADHNLGYEDAVGVARQVTSYLSEERWQDRNIAAHFLMRQYLGLPPAGYVTAAGVFRNLEPDVTDTTEFAVISSVEYTPAFRSGIEARNGVIVKRFEQRRSWSEVYRFR